MSATTACPLDCYDACEIHVQNNLLKGKKSGVTAGFLCPHLNHYSQYKTITSARYKGKEITLDNALIQLEEILKDGEVLHYRGNGNFGLMQEVTDHFFASYGATLTDGTLCDGAGEAGIIAGRGSNKNMPLSEIAKSDVVVLWGRNPHTTSSHLLPLIKNKKIIVIDPVKTKIAKGADLHLQLKPHGDLKLAMLAFRFLLDAHPNVKYKEFHELTKTLKVESTLEEIDVSLGEVEEFIALVTDAKVAIVCGIGVQKYRDGADVMRAIDALAVGLGLFAKEGSGVAYLGNSKEGLTSPFNTKAPRVSKVNTEFSEYKTVFIQGANPLSQMPNSLRVKESLSKVENVVYFGLYENETSEIADLVIPAKTFLSKNDIRTSYSHNAMMQMPKVQENNNGISEYELSARLCKKFDISIKDESFYIEHFKSFSIKDEDDLLQVKERKAIPYVKGFDTEDKKFLFLREFKKDFDNTKGLFLLTPKSPKSLNSQFNREKNVYLHSSFGFKDGEEVEVKSCNGSVKLEVKVDDNLREDCVLVYSGTPMLNNLTSSMHSDEGKCAVYQEEKVSIIKC